jgi:ParB family transcriptional regulator, chromosome partitioning protein
MTHGEIIDIPIKEILVTNPRSRNRKKWLEIVASIRAVGLKRPITVSRCTKPTTDGKRFNLVCGQGRIEALLALGRSVIPAVVIEASQEDQILMSLVENLARKQPSHRDILREVQALLARGYKSEIIAKKLGVDRVFIYGVVHLIERGEQMLVEQVEAGRLPITVAVEIARGNDQAVSLALSEAYRSGELRGAKLSVVRKLVAARASMEALKGKPHNGGRPLTTKALVRVYERTVQDQQALLGRAEKAKQRLLLLSSVFQQLLADERFVELLRAEKLSDMPEKLAERLTWTLLEGRR